MVRNTKKSIKNNHKSFLGGAADSIYSMGSYF